MRRQLIFAGANGEGHAGATIIDGRVKRGRMPGYEKKILPGKKAG